MASELLTHFFHADKVRPSAVQIQSGSPDKLCWTSMSPEVCLSFAQPSTRLTSILADVGSSMYEFHSTIGSSDEYPQVVNPHSSTVRAKRSQKRLADRRASTPSEQALRGVQKEILKPPPYDE